MAKNQKSRSRAADKRKRRELKVRRDKARMGAGQSPRETAATELSTSELPIVECVISKGWEKRGLAHILIARQISEGVLRVGGYYVDTLCMGLKETVFLAQIAEEEYRDNVKPNIFNDPVELVDCDPGLAKAVVEGAVEFASRFGFIPKKKWAQSSRMLAGLELPKKKVVFGKKGVPCYVNRGETNARAILAKLERKAGEGNYLTEQAEQDS